MPVPKPKAGESQDDYISRCMRWMADNEPDRPRDQQLAICFNTYRESKRSNFIYSEPIPIVRSFESDGKRYIYGYAAIFDTPDFFGTVMTKEVVLSSLPHLRKFPAVRFMHRQPLGQIVFDKEVDGVKTFVDEHGFHVLCEIYPERDEEWRMISRGGWGFSYGFMPDPKGSGVQRRNGYDAFVKGTLYEVSVVDSPAHSDAVAYVIHRFLGHNREGGGVMTTQRQMTAKERKRIPKKLGTGGYACKVGDKWKLPIHDAAHVRNAMARYNQAEGCQTSEVKARICAAAKHFGIEGAFEKGGFCYQLSKEEKRMMQEEIRKMEKEELEQWLQEAEQRIIEKVTKAINAKKTTSNIEERLKQMEQRIMTAVEKRLAEEFPPKKVNEIQKTFNTVAEKVKEMDEKIKTLRTIEKSLREAGENYKSISERIVELEKERDKLAESVAKSVEETVQRIMVDYEKRLSAIENIPELRSPATVAKKSLSTGIGFLSQFEAARRGSQ